MNNISITERSERGFIALITVLTISAIALLVSAGILLQSISESATSSAEGEAGRAWAAANGCAEYALAQLSTTTDARPGWADGTGTQMVGSYTCWYAISASNTSKLIQASSSVATFTRKIQVLVATNTPMTITSWQEVGDF